MKPAAFDYVRPSTVAEALSALRDTPGARVIAGGQTLGPMLNLRLAQPPVLVDITRIPELAAVTEERDTVTIGAAVTHAAIEDGRVPDPTGGFLARVARGIAYRAVRTRGTIGGSLAHADPSADWLACLTALRAEVVIVGPEGRRRAPLPAFVRGAMETELAPGEVLAAVRIPRFSRETRFGFHKICRKTGEFADAIGVVVSHPEHGSTCVTAGATLSRPLIMRMEELQTSWRRELEQGASRNVPSPLVGEGQGGGDARTSMSWFPPPLTPPHKGEGNPVAALSNEADTLFGSMTMESARALLDAAGFTGDAYDRALHAAALKRAHDGAFSA
jgi:carbon-monoxide dehydrogenase medium subunit